MNNSTPLPEIGPCIGCQSPGRLDHGVCKTCLAGRGRSWAEMARRVRTEPAFALAVYCEITSDRGRDLFVSLFGRPWLPESENTVVALRRLMARAGWRPASEPAVAAYDCSTTEETARTSRAE